MADQIPIAAVKYKRNAYIMVEGNPAVDRFYIIQEGTVRISREVEVVSDLRGNTLGPGELFGVVSAMSSYHCIETVMAVTDVTLIAVRKEQYGDMIRRNNAVAMKIIQQFSQRLRYLDDAFSRQIVQDNRKDDVPPLFKAAEYYARMRRYNHAYHAYQQYLKYYPKDENVRKVKDQMMKIAPQVTSPKQASQKLNDTERFYSRDTIIFAEGEPGEELYIIRKGSVKISKIVDNQEVLLAVLKPGDTFGEMALLENKPRIAAAVVYEDCLVVAVNRTNFQGLISTQPQLIARLTTVLAERIWLIYKQLANTLIEHPLGRIYNALLIQLEKDRVTLTTNQSHLCNFGIQELVGIAGIPAEESEQLVKKILLSKRVTLFENKVYVADASDVVRQAEYYRRAQRNISRSGRRQN